ncbi:MAG TPA: S49 family peptidase [Caulobacteraceae bacterium]|jgi:ClpP class serine protease|nr:S49 family peptidase [Caulobacteraceae bacterium]
MTRAFRALTAEPWAIEPSWLPILAAIALRDRPTVTPEPTWAAHDMALLAGPGGRKMEGARYAVTTADGVALIPVFGPILPRANLMSDMSGATTCSGLSSDYQLCLSNPEVGAVLFMIDSPGGPVSGIAALADQIWANRNKMPTAGHVMGSAASAAYWVGSQMPQLTADRTALVGSIGVIAGMKKQVEPDGEGMMSFDVVSSNAPDKVPDPETDAGMVSILGMLDAIEAQFIADVARGRATTATRVKSDFGQGGVLVGQAAAAAGMVDAITSFDAAYRGLAQQVANQRKLKALKA